MKGTIEIYSLRLFAHHGVAAQERAVGNTFEVSLSVNYPMDEAVGNDNLGATLDYGTIIQLIKREMEIPSMLLEHAAGRIVNALRHEFPAISSGKIKVTKVTPPCGVEVKGVSVILEW
ncbi:MAG: dihydroneopterin aldolase [Paramuribaculum sp.]|nr:dihydroneopterin aldolase [Paramuribaculum sp.]